MKVLFETHHLYYWPNFMPVVQEMLRREKFEINVSIPKRTISIQENILFDACKEIGVQFITADTEEERIFLLSENNYDIIVVGNVGQLNKIIRSDAVAVMVYHGIGLKNSYYNDVDNRINIRSVESLARYDELKSHGHNNLFLTGFTKLDRLSSISNNFIDNIKSSLKIDPRKKTILYAPSFYPTSIEKICPFLPDLIKDYNLIIKLHGFSWEQKKYLYQNVICSTLSQNNKGIYLLPNDCYDIIPYYILSDILISDISSTMFEYLALNKPIIQARCYSLKLRHRIFYNRFMKKMDFERQESVDFAYQISDPADLLSRVYFALDNINEMSQLRKEASDYYLMNADGKASSRLVDEIENY